MRAAAVQLNSNEDPRRNVQIAERLVREAASEGAELVVLPEKYNVLGEDEHYEAHAESLDGPTLTSAGALAAELSIDLVAGSVVERRDGRERLSNTSVHFGPDGDARSVYRKIHMFDVVVGGTEYRESSTQEAGGEIVVSELADGTELGMTVCYDVRFPELYRILALRGARVIAIPAAFTKVTGEAHWDVLVRARAIENQAFVVAANQFGLSGARNESYGGSVVVDPWGEVLARAAEGEGLAIADLDLGRLEQIRADLPSLKNRVDEAYRWPEEVPH